MPSSVIILRPNEAVVWLARRHWALYIGRIVAGLAIFFSGVWFWRFFWSHPSWGLFALLGIFAIGLIITMRAWLQWRLSTITLTTERLVVVDQKGLFERKVSEVPFEQVLDVGYHLRGLSQMLVGYGAVEIRTSVAKEVIRFEWMPKPRLLRDRIVESWEAFRKERASAGR